ncbi:MAG: hypothetical protein NTV32_09440 [Gammaproteobacteria bacterium]|nr:hypothetical protein [Gammaproteobacteria bacterium]
MLNILKGFLPWILFSVLYGNTPGQFEIALWIALISTVILDRSSFKEGNILSWVSLVYFLLLLVSCYYFPSPWLQANMWVVSNGVLASMAFGSCLAKQPFTYQYAKKQVPKAHWNSSLFIQINTILTYIWGVIFLLTALIDWVHVHHAHMNTVLFLILNNLGWFVGMAISKKFPPYWKKRKQEGASV